MKLQHLIAIGIAAAFAATVVAKDAVPAAKPADAKAPAAGKQCAPKPQTLCPITGKAIDKTQYVDVGACRIYVCCQDCIEKVKADPQAAKKKVMGAGECCECICTKCSCALEKTAACGEDSMQCPKCKAVQKIKADCAGCPMKAKKEEAKTPAAAPAPEAKDAPAK